MNKLREEMMKQIKQNTSDAERLDSAQRSVDRRYLENNISSDEFYSAPSSLYNSSGSIHYYSDPIAVQPLLNYNYDMRPNG